MKNKKRLLSGITILILLFSLSKCSLDTSKKEYRANFGQRQQISYSLLQKNFRNPDMIYAPFIFWFWDEPIDQEKMAEMSRVMCSQGFNPGYAHARRSMVGTPDLPDDEWLGDKWFSSFNAALSEAEKQNKYLGYCDEYWWPSFQAHGRVLKRRPDLKAESLKWEINDVPGGTEVEVSPSFFAVAARIDMSGKNDSALIRSNTILLIGSGEGFIWKAPQDGVWRIYTFNKYFHKGMDGGEVNAIDGKLAEAFCAIALEPYVRKLNDRLGKSIPGDFIDHEGDYGWKLAWSNTLDSCYRQRFGKDIRLIMPLMINRDAEGCYAKIRWEWFDLVSDLYADNFRMITDWHEQRGMYTTAHFWEESIPLQVNSVGDHMKMLRSVTMPGQDCLGRKAVQVHDFKEIQSVAEFQDTRATTELMGAGIFGAAGSNGPKGKHWETFNPSFLKQAINAVTAWGMSHIIPHGIFTTRKLTGNPWPPDWYSENPMFPWMHLWSDFARRTCYINSMGYAVPEVLLYNPMESAWINTHAAMLDENVWNLSAVSPDWKRNSEINQVYTNAINELTDARIEFLVGDRYYLNQMKIKKNKLIFGNLSFGTIVLPEVDILTLDVAKKIVAFAKAGGRVYSIGELPAASAGYGMNDPEMKKLMDNLKSLPSYTFCGKNLKSWIGKKSLGMESQVRFNSGDFPMLQHHRRIDGKEFFWLANNNDQIQNCEITILNARGGASSWDCETGEIRPVGSEDSDIGCVLKLRFSPLEGYWIVIDPDSTARTFEEKPESQILMTIDGKWKVSYDLEIQPDMEFQSIPPVVFNDGIEKQLEDWSNWNMQKFSGLIDYTKIVEIGKVDEQIFIDLGKVCHASEVWINGQNAGAKLWGPHVFDITNEIKSGPNEIKIRIANLINNSYDDIQESGLIGPVRIMTSAQ